MMKRNLSRNLVIVMILMAMLFTTACNGGEPSEQADAGQNADSGQVGEKDAAEAWPEKTIQFTVPYNAGGDTDLYCRTTAKYMEDVLGETIIVVNTSGSSGMAAAHQVMESKADGYTLMFRHTAQLITQATGMADLSYTEDMEIGGCIIDDSTYTLVVRKDSGFKNLSDLVEFAKANPNELTYSNVYGSVTHYVSIKMREQMGIEFKDLDVGSSSSDRIAAFMGGQVDMIVANYAQLKDYIETGDFVVMGILANDRVPALPEVPTMKEQGYDVVSQKIYTFAFPEGTDEAIVDKFNSALEEVSQNPEYQKEIESFYGSVNYKSPEDTYEFETEMVDELRSVMESSL